MKKLIILCMLTCSIVLFAACKKEVPSVYSTEKIDAVKLLMFEIPMEDPTAVISEIMNGRDISELNDIEKYNVELVQYFIEAQNPEFSFMKKTGYTFPGALYYDYNTDIEIDLNGDNTNETLRVEEVEGNVTLKVNNVNAPDVYLDSRTEKFAIAPFNNNSMIILSEYGPSDDPFSRFYLWNGTEIVDMAEGIGSEVYERGLQGIVTPEVVSINFDPQNALLKSNYRAGVLQTWWYEKVYKIEDGKIEEMLPGAGYYETEYHTFTLKDIVLLDEMNDNANTFTLKEGERVVLTATDDKNYIRVEDKDTRKAGWFKLQEGFGNIVNSSQNLEPRDVFLNLCFAD